ncbi:hypothetical protein TYRP_001297 [Tyrophagus putrescentiae]|nr:hypothetical protein TYRP_001297 [Tyrophagus putrescentiae]
MGKPLSSPSSSANCLVNNRPVLGVLLLENADKSGQFIGASYVKFLESAGARVVPIFLKQKQSYYQEMVSSLNGILMPWRQQQRHSL